VTGMISMVRSATDGLVQPLMDRSYRITCPDFSLALRLVFDLDPITAWHEHTAKPCFYFFNSFAERDDPASTKHLPDRCSKTMNASA
jgi:hypothetical protein